MFDPLAIAIGDLSVASAASGSAAMDPIWDGIPEDPISLTPTGFTSLSFLTIYDTDATGGTYLVALHPDNGQLKWDPPSGYGGLTLELGSTGTWTGDISVSGSRDEMATYLFPYLQYRPDGFTGDTWISAELSEDDGPVDTRNINIHSAPVALAIAVDTPVISSVLEGVLFQLDLMNKFTGGSDPSNWTFSVTGGDDQVLFYILDGTKIAMDPQNFESPTDLGLDNEYNVVVTCNDSGTEESVTLEFAVTVLDANEEIIDIAFTEIPVRGEFTVHTSAGDINCQTPLAYENLQASFDAALGSGKSAISDVTPDSFRITFADELGDIEPITLYSVEGLRYRSSGITTLSPEWAAVSVDGGPYDVGWINETFAQIIDGTNFATANNSDAYGGSQKAMRLAWSFTNTGGFGEVEVVNTSFQVRGNGYGVGSYPKVSHYGWRVNNGTYRTVDTSIEFPPGIDYFPLFTDAPEGTSGANHGELETALSGSQVIEFFIVPEMLLPGDTVYVDGGSLYIDYYPLSTGMTYSVTVVQEGG